jgi:hypothetical protein
MFFGLSLESLPKNIAQIWKIGFGNIAGNNLLNMSTSVLGGVILANTPQMVLSYLYLAFNAVYTEMLVAKEWSSYVDGRKALRVTAPIGQQRTSYWLSVPFRFALPMTIMSGLLHWLTSSGFFAAHVTILDALDRSKIAKDISTCGFSPIAMILTIITATIVYGSGLYMSMFKYTKGIPLASSCSAAISAACHPPAEDVNAGLLPIQWGATTHDRGVKTSTGAIGHCCFTSLPVKQPKTGRRYA